MHAANFYIKVVIFSL